MGKKDKTNRASQFSAKALKHIIKAGRKTPRLYVLIAEAMSKRSKESFHRQEVAYWLHEDPNERIEPRLGAGLLLIEVANDVLLELAVETVTKKS